VAVEQAPIYPAVEDVLECGVMGERLPLAHQPAGLARSPGSLAPGGLICRPRRSPGRTRSTGMRGVLALEADLAPPESRPTARTAGSMARCAHLCGSGRSMAWPTGPRGRGRRHRRRPIAAVEPHQDAPATAGRHGHRRARPQLLPGGLMPLCPLHSPDRRSDRDDRPPLDAETPGRGRTCGAPSGPATPPVALARSETRWSSCATRSPPATPGPTPGRRRDCGRITGGHGFAFGSKLTDRRRS
jgi:hypothetical protein